MNLTRCNRGHYYDSDMFNYCPHCAEQDNNKKVVSMQGINLEEVKRIKYRSDTLRLIHLGLYENETLLIYSYRNNIFHFGNSFAEIKSKNSLISNNHAQFCFDDGKWYITDNNSKNGTYLNGTPLVPYKEYPLTNGDKIDFAHCEFFIFKDNAAEEQKNSNQKDYYFACCKYSMLENHNTDDCKNLKVREIKAEYGKTPATLTPEVNSLNVCIENDKIVVSHFIDINSFRIYILKEFELVLNKIIPFSVEIYGKVYDCFIIVSDKEFEITDYVDCYVKYIENNCIKKYVNKTELSEMLSAIIDEGNKTVQEFDNILNSLDGEKFTSNIKFLNRTGFIPEYYAQISNNSLFTKTINPFEETSSISKIEKTLPIFD